VREGRAIRTEVLEQRSLREEHQASYDQPYEVTLPTKQKLVFKFLETGNVSVTRVGQAPVEMKPEDIGAGFTSSVASSAFLSLTGFHGVHVTIGIIILLTTLALSLRGRLPRSKAESVEIVGLYWHFVDVVWILIFTVVYLIR
jgi:hypothetical protein